MTIASITAKEPGERGNIQRDVPFPAPANEQQDLIYVIALVKATRERKLATLRVSEPAGLIERLMMTTFAVLGWACAWLLH